jgi:hypothetical protein
MRWNRDPHVTRTLYLAWRCPKGGRWFPVGRLTRDEDEYAFVYTRGFAEAQASADMPFIIGFPVAERVYRSNALFPIFRNRVMNSSRPDHPEYLESLGLPQATDALEELARTTGLRATDSFKVYPGVEPRTGPEGEPMYRAVFFVHGLRHRPPVAQARARALTKDASLSLMWDFQNPHDANAVVVRTEDFVQLGFVPRYHSPAMVELARRGTPIRLSAERVNAAPTPWSRTLLCAAEAPWPAGFEPHDASHEPLVEERTAVRAGGTD